MPIQQDSITWNSSLEDDVAAYTRICFCYHDTPHIQALALMMYQAFRHYDGVTPADAYNATQDVLMQWSERADTLVAEVRARK